MKYLNIALTLSFVFPLAHSDLPEIWSIVCLTFGWGTYCKNFLQASVLGVGGVLNGKNTQNAVDCMLHETPNTCTSATTTDGMKCDWCPFEDPWKEKFGSGACMLKILKTLGCSLTPATFFEPVSEYNVTIPSAHDQALCLQHNKSKQDCESKLHGGFQCRYCDAPDVYKLKPYTGICLQEELMYHNLNGACKLLKDLPDKK